LAKFYQQPSRVIFPFLSKTGAKVARHDHANEADQPSPETKASCLRQSSVTLRERLSSFVLTAAKTKNARQKIAWR
jgi:hypothetical protein